MQMLDMSQCYIAVARYAIQSQRQREIDRWQFHPIEFLKQHRSVHLDLGRCTYKTVAAIEIAKEHKGIVVAINNASANWMKYQFGYANVIGSKRSIDVIRSGDFDIVVIDEPACHKPADLDRIYEACAEAKIQNVVMIGR